MDLCEKSKDAVLKFMDTRGIVDDVKAYSKL